jgi:hypothetical protein
MLGIEAVHNGVCIPIGDVDVPIPAVDGDVGRVVERCLQLRSCRIADGPEFASHEVEGDNPMSVAVYQDDLVVGGDEYPVCVRDEAVPPPADEVSSRVEDDDRRITALENVDAIL